MQNRPMKLAPKEPIEIARRYVAMYRPGQIEPADHWCYSGLFKTQTHTVDGFARTLPTGDLDEQRLAALIEKAKGDSEQAAEAALILLGAALASFTELVPEHLRQDMLDALRPHLPAKSGYATRIANAGRDMCACMAMSALLEAGFSERAASRAVAEAMAEIGHKFDGGAESVRSMWKRKRAEEIIAHVTADALVPIAVKPRV